MDAPTLLALAHGRCAAGEAQVQNVWASNRALGLVWAPERRAGLGSGLVWIFLVSPKPFLWLLHESDPACAALKAEAKVDLSRRWGQELKGAHLEDVEGDPRERWLGLRFRRRAITGRIEVTRLAFQAIPGRSGLRLDGLDLNQTRIGMGTPFAATPPEPTPHDPPPLVRWKARFGEAWEAVITAPTPDVLPGEGSLLDRHQAMSSQQATELILAPKQAAVGRKLGQEQRKLERYREALGADRARHLKALELREPAAALSAELYRLRGAVGEVELLDGRILKLAEGFNAERTAQRWFAAVKRAERGLGRLRELEAELTRRLCELERQLAAPPDPIATPAPRKEKTRMKPQDERTDRRADGKGKAYRSVMVDDFEVLIGKGDADNDALTFKVGEPHDLWLHVANVPGSHVIIRNPDKLSELPRDVVERAAQLAAWHSKAREAGKVEVHLCRVADVSKPRGFAPGKVLLRTFKSVRVYPKA